MNRGRQNRKLKYIKIKKIDYYHLIKRISLLTESNKKLKYENINYRQMNEVLKNELDSFNRTIYENKNLENQERQKNKIMENVIIDGKEESIEYNNDNELDDMEDELYEENDNITDSDNDSVHSNYSETNKGNIRKQYNKLDNNEEELKVVNKLKKNYLNVLKNGKDFIFNEMRKNNRNTLKLFSDIYKKYINNKIDGNYINNIYELYDKNKSRFIKNLEICYKIYNNNKLINSDYIFPLYTFNYIKKSSIDNLIELIENVV